MLILTLLLSLLPLSLCSTGDRLIVFDDCLKSCLDTCDTRFEMPLDTFQRFTFWSCTDNCKYNCMHKVTNEAIAAKAQVHQFYGKWPFWRFAGMQEPASVAFSIGNGYMHYKGLQKYLSRTAASGRYQLRPIVVAYGIVAINTWVWSSVFHTRDLPVTEKLDYFSAMLGLLVALFYGLHRIFRVPFASRVSLALLLSFLVFFLYHISYLSFYRFDYGYNMKASIAVAISHNLIWLAWSFWNWERIPHAWHMCVVVVALTATALLEIFDFPAYWRILDAHSLWHASTIPCVRLYWEFLLKDTIYQLSLEKLK